METEDVAAPRASAWASSSGEYTADKLNALKKKYVIFKSHACSCIMTATITSLQREII